MLKIGLTGGIATGKSYVLERFRQHGVPCLDADELAHGVTAAGTEATAAIAARFGADVLAADGSVDRKKLGPIVFRDPAARRELEAIVHPAVRPRILAAVDAADAALAPAVVIEAIKLVEGGLAELCDQVWLVTCDAAAQRGRVLARGTPEDDADRRIAAQAGLAERLAWAATHVIDTSGDAAGTRGSVEALFRAALSSSA